MNVDFMLALLTTVVSVITISICLTIDHYREYHILEKHFAGRFGPKIYYPEEGEDYKYCDICHGRLGAERMAVCSCGGRFHIECVREEDCPRCGNDLGHMRKPLPKVLRCPVCLGRTFEGTCYRCGLTIPERNGTFRCQDCGGKVMASNPVCRKCGMRYTARTTKGYMDRVR